MKSAFILLCLMCAHVAYSQPADRALVDEFGQASCDDLKARIDNFYTQLKSKPAARGLVVIHPKGNDVLSALRYEELIRAAFDGRRYDITRAQFVRAASEPSLHIELKMLAPDDNPTIQGSGWNLNLGGMKPFELFEDWFYQDDICPPFDGLHIYKELLLKNSSSRANIVIRAGSALERNTNRKRLVASLAKSGIEENRIRFFFVKRYGRRSTMREPDTEYWVVPSAK